MSSGCSSSSQSTKQVQESRSELIYQKDQKNEEKRKTYFQDDSEMIEVVRMIEYDHSSCIHE